MRKIKIFLSLLFIFIFILGFLFENTYGQISPTPAENSFSDPLEKLERMVEEDRGRIGGECLTDEGLPFLRLPYLAAPFPLSEVSDYIINIINSLADIFINPLINKVRNLAFIFFRMEKIPCTEGEPITDPETGRCLCVDPRNKNLARLCLPISNSNESGECARCMDNGQGIWTALGCFSSDLPTLIKEKFFGIGIGLAGFVALLCIVYAAFTLQTSQGNPEKIKKAQELLTSCIMGLMLIIFSIFILKVIGVDILKIPGFK